MQLRCLHANSFAFEVRDHDPDSDGRPGASADLSGAIVVFVAVERADADRSVRTADAAADRITEMADQLDEHTVAVVPFAGLTDSPATKSVASELVDDLVSRLDFETHTVPLGEPISFELDARGHPFANQHFEIEPTDRPDGEWFVIGEDGSFTEADAERPVLDDGQLIDLMPLDRLADSADGGPVLFDENGTFLPEGTVLRDLVVEAVADRLRADGAFPVDQSARTDAETAVVGGESLRSVFETTADQPGPELTTAVSTRSDALVEADEQIALVSDLLADLSVFFEPVCRVTEMFLDEHRDWIAALADQFDQPLLLERRAGGSTPFRLDFAVLGEHARLVTPAVWLDDSRDSDSTTLVHSTPLGDSTRFVAALCRTTAASDRPCLPTWLAPIQVRLVPIEPDDIETCDRIAERLETRGVRVDIDDRDVPVSERLDTADEEWIPHDAVVGEEDGDSLRVTSRAEQTERELTPAELAARISEESAEWPAGTRPVPRHYSDRPAVLR
ncbi:threonyl-tRNA synthetase editing domain-containing protein [Halovenus sp. HT40]|uniref:threonyl-tRNA synthetase editing domain-containing protein n=1 Tax=Halovenus sp. HT40 TaxID=3126691 RepID=UPI00300F2B88